MSRIAVFGLALVLVIGAGVCPVRATHRVAELRSCRTMARNGVWRRVVVETVSPLPAVRGAAAFAAAGRPSTGNLDLLRQRLEAMVRRLQPVRQAADVDLAVRALARLRELEFGAADGCRSRSRRRRCN